MCYSSGCMYRDADQLAITRLHWRTLLLASLLAGAAWMLAGCSDRPSPQLYNTATEAVRAGADRDVDIHGAQTRWIAALEARVTALEAAAKAGAK